MNENVKNTPEILAPGLLIAMPQLQDETFEESVILLIDHSENGAMGLIVNQPVLEPTLLEVARAQGVQLADRLLSMPVYQGGPMETERGFLIHDNPDLPDAIPLTNGLFLALTADPLKLLLQNPGETHFKFIIGYSSWGEKQLDDELSRGVWLPTGCSAERVLSFGGEEFWEDAIRAEGISPAELLGIPSGIN